MISCGCAEGKYGVNELFSCETSVEVGVFVGHGLRAFMNGTEAVHYIDRDFGGSFTIDPTGLVKPRNLYKIPFGES